MSLVALSNRNNQARAARLIVLRSLTWPVVGHLAPVDAQGRLLGCQAAATTRAAKSRYE